MVVETGADNQPAISLYKKFDFTLEKTWESREGITLARFARIQQRPG
jgi:ribosomal protein S18 acetylase RimI-like enzyme